MWFFEWWYHVISHYSVTFGVHRIYLSRDYICSTPICKPCLDLKFLLPRFVIFLPRFEIPKNAPFCNSSCPNLHSLKPAPVCNPLIAPFCNPKKISRFFVFSHFGTGIWTWTTFEIVVRIWWNLVWEALGMIAKNDLRFNKSIYSHWWRHHLVLFWYWNLDMSSSWLSR